MEPPSCILDDYVSCWIALILVLLLYTTFSSSKLRLLRIQNDSEYPFGIMDLLLSFLRIAIIVLIASIFLTFFSETYSLIINFVMLTVVSAITILLFGKLIPGLIVDYLPGTSAVISKSTLLILSPLKGPYSKLLKKYNHEINQNNNESEEQVIEEIIEPEQKELIKGIIEFSATQVSGIMTKREDIIGIEIDCSSEAALTTAIESGFSRLPVYRGSFDNIEGFIYIKDMLGLLKCNNNTDWHSFIREAHFTQCSKPIIELLDELRENKIHLAIVLDEHEKCSGLVTMEDIIEEIVGEISDETDNSF